MKFEKSYLKTWSIYRVKNSGLRFFYKNVNQFFITTEKRERARAGAYWLTFSLGNIFCFIILVQLLTYPCVSAIDGVKLLTPCPNASLRGLENVAWYFFAENRTVLKLLFHDNTHICIYTLQGYPREALQFFAYIPDAM